MAHDELLLILLEQELPRRACLGSAKYDDNHQVADLMTILIACLLRNRLLKSHNSSSSARIVLFAPGATNIFICRTVSCCLTTRNDPIDRCNTFIFPWDTSLPPSNHHTYMMMWFVHYAKCTFYRWRHALNAFQVNCNTLTHFLLSSVLVTKAMCAVEWCWWHHLRNPHTSTKTPSVRFVAERDVGTWRRFKTWTRSEK